MEYLVNTFKKDGILFTKTDKISKVEVYIVSEDESIKIRTKKFKDFYIICSECGAETHINQIQAYHLHNKYICKSCNHKGERNPMYGKSLTNEQKQKISERVSGSNNPFYGKTHSKETRDKISKANKGRLSGEKNPMFGINIYEYVGEEKAKEMKQHLSEACKGELNGFYGKHHTEEFKKAQSEFLKNSKEFHDRIKSPEYRIKVSNSLKNSQKLKESRQSEEYRNKKRLQFSKCIQLGTKPKVCFNPKACAVFDIISAKEGIKIQHAMNGGEFMVPDLGYWLDGYDAENNVAYEYDEKHHFIGGKLREEDIKRQKVIEDKLKCTFIRIKDEDYKNFEYKEN